MGRQGARSQDPTPTQSRSGLRQRLSLLVRGAEPWWPRQHTWAYGSDDFGTRPEVTGNSRN
eukprot:38876-Pyramimonas_sp.AAC.1